MISISGLSKSFNGNAVLDGIDLDIAPGERVVVIGPSGTGKSVFLKLLVGLLYPDAGEIWVDGVNVATASDQELYALRRRIGMLFQGSALFDSLCVADNIAYPLRQHGWRDTARITERVAEVLEMVNLPGIERKWPAELSGGMKKRVGLARAIAIQPEVLLYDEPTTGLDPTNVKRIDELILDLQERLGVTSLVVTHDMDSAFRVSDRLAMLYDKKIVWAGFKDEVENADNPVVRAFIEGNIGE